MAVARATVLKALTYLLLVLAAKHNVNGLCSSDRRPYELFGTKTFYDKVAGKLPRLSQRNPPGCTPVYVYGVLRHGARYPSSLRVMSNMQELLGLAKLINSTRKQPELCDKDLEAIRNWNIWLDEYATKNLTSEGAYEMERLALRLQNFLPEIMGKSVSASKFKFTTTNCSRTSDSMHAFANAMLSSENTSNISYTTIPKDENNDLDEDNCLKYVRDVGDNPNITSEYDRFLQGPFLTRIKRKIARRLGVRKERISNEFVWTIYSDGCYSQQWVEGRLGPWCSVFTRRDLKLLEYASDLEDYYEKGFSIPIAYKWSCQQAKRIVTAIKKASELETDNQDHAFGQFVFAHSDNIISTAANMMLFSDEETLPTADNYNEQRSRTFKMSKLLPSAANLIFVLYRCASADGTASTFHVQTFWNERLLTSFPACETSRGMCDMATWLDTYAQFITGSELECNQREICAI